MGGRSTSRGRVLLACLTGLGGCAVDSTPSPFELSTTEAQLPASTSTTTGETGSTGTTEVLDTTGVLPTGTTSPGTTAVPVECGNGVVESGEECDDGNLDDTDACLSSCAAARCGDGVVHQGIEACDDGNLDDADACLSTCIVATCGDGVVRADVEECDDANTNETDACRNSCMLAVCGDGVVQDGVETCDEGGETATCDADCTKPECGDGVVNKTAGEECDDGNDIYADNCYPTCVAPSMQIFLSSEVYYGGLGGVAGADQKCQALAKKAGLAGTYKAWLWTSNSGPEVTFYQSPGRYIRPDLVKVANNFAHLLHGPLMAPIVVTEKKEKIADLDTPIWTGWYPFDQNGMNPFYDEYTCGDWTYGEWGKWAETGGVSFADSYFFGKGSGLNCGIETLPIICVQQAWLPP